MAMRTYTYWIASVIGDPLNSIRGRTKNEVLSKLEAAGAVKETARAQGIGGAPGALVHTWFSESEDIAWHHPEKTTLYYDGDLLSLIEQAFMSELGY